METVLSNNDTILEFDSQGHWFLKIRSFFIERSDLGEDCDKTFTDIYVHHIDSKQNQGNVYYRKRVDENDLKEEIIKKNVLKDLTPCAHCYNSEKFSVFPSDMLPFMKYKFKRWYREFILDEEHTELYIDKVIEPVEYTIETLRIKLDFNPNTPNFTQKLHNMLHKYTKYTQYPVYSKFLLVLQCSIHFELCNTLYCQYDPNYQSVLQKVAKILKDTELTNIDRDYIWFVNNQIQRVQLMFDMECEESVCYKRLKTLRPSGSESYECYDECEW